MLSTICLDRFEFHFVIFAEFLRIAARELTRTMFQEYCVRSMSCRGHAWSHVAAIQWKHFCCMKYLLQVKSCVFIFGCMTGFIFSCHLIYASLCFSTPVSSLVFGTNALFTKPAQSVAPMLIVAILSSYGYEVSRI